LDLCANLFLVIFIRIVIEGKILRSTGTLRNYVGDMKYVSENINKQQTLHAKQKALNFVSVRRRIMT